MPALPLRRRRSAGFTIMELMISVAIIGVMAMAVAPSLSEVLSDNRQHSAAMEVVKFARRARAQALLTGTSQVIRFRETASELGVLDLSVAMNNKCFETQTLFTPTAEVVDMRDFNPTTYGGGGPAPTKSDPDRHVIYLDARLGSEAAPTVTELRICYQPNGAVLVDADGPAGAPLTPQGQAILFTVNREINLSPRGRTRQILLPVGGNARLR